MGKDRCYIIQDKDGNPFRIRAGKMPNGASLRAIQELFNAAYKHMAKSGSLATKDRKSVV